MFPIFALHFASPWPVRQPLDNMEDDRAMKKWTMEQLFVQFGGNRGSANN
jgi:hypothetical protein